jgi:hypothetical protein
MYAYIVLLPCITLRGGVGLFLFLFFYTTTPYIKKDKIVIWL